jgi:hypothetical protein
MAGLWQDRTATAYRQYQNLRPGSSPCNVG